MIKIPYQYNFTREALEQGLFEDQDMVRCVDYQPPAEPGESGVFKLFHGSGDSRRGVRCTPYREVAVFFLLGARESLLHLVGDEQQATDLFAGSAEYKTKEDEPVRWSRMLVVVDSGMKWLHYPNGRCIAHGPACADHFFEQGHLKLAIPPGIHLPGAEFLFGRFAEGQDLSAEYPELRATLLEMCRSVHKLSGSLLQGLGKVLNVDPESFMEGILEEMELQVDAERLDFELVHPSAGKADAKG